MDLECPEKVDTQIPGHGRTQVIGSMGNSRIRMGEIAVYEFKGDGIKWFLAAVLTAGWVSGCASLGLSGPLEDPGIPSPLPPTLISITAEPGPSLTPPAVTEIEPEFFVFLDNRVSRVDNQGSVLTSWPVRGLDPSITRQYQFVIDALYYLDPGSGNVYLNREGSEVSLEFAGGPVHGFTVSVDGTRFAWSIHEPGRNELWISLASGLGKLLVVDAPPGGASNSELVLEPLHWTDTGALIFTWNYLAMGEGLSSEAFGSLYLYDPERHEVVTLAPLPEEPTLSCWRAITRDAGYAAGVCPSTMSSQQQLTVVEISSGIEERLLVFEGQSLVRAAAFSDRRQVAYVIHDRTDLVELEKVVIRSFPGDEPAVLLVLENQEVGHLEWLGEEHLLIEAGAPEQPEVLLLSLVGQQRRIAAGWLLGWVNAASAAE